MSKKFVKDVYFVDFISQVKEVSADYVFDNRTFSATIANYDTSKVTGKRHVRVGYTSVDG